MPEVDARPPGTVIPENSLTPGDFVAACKEAPESLVYFLLNVGDGDTQLILLPADKTGSRRCIVVDIATTKKLPSLIKELARQQVLVEPDQHLIALLVATHPHDDHIGGMAEFIDRFGEHISEFWEPGYYHPTAGYVEMMRAVEEAETILHTQPTSGTTRYIGKVRITVITPGITLRGRFDSYGTNINDSSIALRVGFPAARLIQQGENRRYAALRDPWSILLGADAQTTSWGQAAVDFPQLHPGNRAVLAEELKKVVVDPLRADVFKVPHHGSKHGVNLELVERIDPRFVFVSSVGGRGKYNFPHMLAMESIREAKEPTTTKGGPHSDDFELGISTTHDRCGDKKPGSIALMLSPKRGSRPTLWRFLDEPNDPLRINDAYVQSEAREA